MTPKSASIHEDPRSSASVPRTPISRSPCPSTPSPSPVPPIPKIEFDMNGVPTLPTGLPKNILGGLDAVWSTAQDVSISNMTPYSSPINKNNLLPPLKPKIIPRIIPQVKVSPASKEKEIKNIPLKPTSAKNDSNQLTIPNDKSKKLRNNSSDSYGTTTMLNNPVNKKSASEVAKRTNLVKFTSCCPMLKLVKRCY